MLAELITCLAFRGGLQALFSSLVRSYQYHLCEAYDYDVDDRGETIVITFYPGGACCSYLMEDGTVTFAGPVEDRDFLISETYEIVFEYLYLEDFDPDLEVEESILKRLEELKHE